jgi:hypothetical protein
MRLVGKKKILPTLHKSAGSLQSQSLEINFKAKSSSTLKGTQDHLEINFKAKVP